MNSYIYALGFFDGVHVGHQALLKTAAQLAAASDCRSGVITFSAHPDTLVLGRTTPLINTPQDREDILLHGFSMERVVTLPFDRNMLTTPWQDFLELLRRDYGAAGFVCGADFRFGSRGAGSAESLARYCREAGLPWAVVPDQCINGIRVSSTYIRSLLEAGEMEQAVQFLGHPHILSGTVVCGQQLGRTLGIPTANLLLPEGLVIPRFGVYACKALVNGSWHPAVTNVGTRPTVAGQGITVEPWILDFSGDLYGQPLTLEFHAFLRPETRFPSLEAMQAEIFRNAGQTRAFFAGQGPEPSSGSEG